MKKLYLISFLLLIAFRPIQAETLIELYQLAVQNDPKLKIAYQERVAVREKKHLASAPLAPEVILGANATETLQTENWLIGNDRESTTIGYDVTLRYPLYRRNLNIALEQVDSEIKQADAKYESARQALMAKLASRYFDVLAANDNLKFTVSAKKAFKQQLEEALIRFEVGLLSITDVEEAKAAYDLTVSDEILAQNQIDNALESLREVTGRYHRVLATLKEKTPLLPPNPADVNKWTVMALEQNPDVLATQFAIETAYKEIAKERAANLPTIDLVAKHSYNDVFRGDDNPPGTLTTSNSVGIQLNYFLFEGGGIRSRTKIAQVRRIQAVDKLEEQRRATQLQTRQAYWNLLSNISRVKALKQALISSETALKATQKGFEVGTRTSVDVVKAQRDLLRAQSDYSKVRYDYVVSTVLLKQAAGSLNEEDLVAINKWLQNLN